MKMLDAWNALTGKQLGNCSPELQVKDTQRIRYGARVTEKACSVGLSLETFVRDTGIKGMAFCKPRGQQKDPKEAKIMETLFVFSFVKNK